MALQILKELEFGNACVFCNAASNNKKWKQSVMTELNLGESIDISRVGIVYSELNNTLQASSAVNLNLSEITHIDGAGIQLIYAYLIAARKQDLEVSISEPSASVRTAAEILGLEKLMSWSS